MKKLFRVVQFGANLGIITIALILGFMLIRSFLVSPTDSTAKSSSLSSKQIPSSRDLAGRQLDLVGADWSKSEETAVFYLSTTCGYCTQSVPFYKRMLQQKPERIRTVAVFLQDQKVVGQYLESHGLKFDDVLSGSLDAIGVTGTPTLLIVDRNGVVAEAWRGKLSPEREEEFMKKLLS